MRKLILLFLSIFIVISMVACGSNTKVDESVQEDLLNYANVEIQKVVPLETDVASSYESVSGDNYTDDATMLNALETHIIPQSIRLIEAAESINVDTQQVEDVHNLYISALTEQHSAFTIMATALEDQSMDGITKANEKLDIAIKQTEDYLSKIKKLSEENNINFDIE